MLDVDDDGLSPSDPVSLILPDGVGVGESSQTSVPHGAVLSRICAHRSSRGTGGSSMSGRSGWKSVKFCWMRVEDEGTG